MYKIKEFLSRFMYGRYGTDQLYFALFVTYIILFIVNLFARTYIISVFQWFIIIYMLFRVFSKKIYARQKENMFFLNYWSKIKKWSNLSAKRLKEIKTKRYRKCPNCSANLRLNRKLGKHIVNCPRCNKDFTVTIRI